MKRKIASKVRGFPAALIALLMGAFVLLPGISWSVTPAGTDIINLAPADYEVGSNSYAATSNQTTVTVNTITSINITPPHTEYLQAGKSISLTHTVTNNSNIDDTIDIEAVSLLGLTVELFESNGTTPLTDTDNNGKPDTGLLALGSSVDIVVKTTAPLSAPVGQTDTTTITATSGIDPSKTASLIDTLTILKATFWDPLVKSVDPPGQVTQGSIITYTNTFGNDGNIPATNAVITDILDPDLIYIAGSATEPPGISGTVISYNPVTRTVTWTIPSIPAGYIGQVGFKATIGPDTSSDTNIENTISITSDQTPATQTSNTVTTAVVEQPLRIRKSANKEVAEIGDYVVYTVEVENASTTLTVDSVTITDSLPQGFRYLKDSSTLDDADFDDPETGSLTTWNIGTLGLQTTKTLTYRAIVSIDAPMGDGTNSASVSAKTSSSNNLFAGPAAVTVKVEEGVLNSKAIILGRVFVDLNRDNMPDTEEPGMRGVRLYLEDGTYVITDEQGKFFIYGIEAGEHVLKIDSATIPSGYNPVPLDSSFAGNGGSRFITVPFGGPARGDFGLVQDSQETGVIPADEEKSPAGTKKKFTFSVGSNTAPLPLEKQIQGMPRTADILEPQDKTILDTSWSNIVVRVPSDTAYALTVNGVPLTEKQVGKIIEESRKKITIYEYVGIALSAGTNSIVLETEQADGSKQKKKINIHVPGTPEKLFISPDKADIPSDGETVVPFTVQLLDQWDNPVLNEHILTVITEKGVVIDLDLDESKPGYQIKAEKGKAVFKLRSTLKTGRDRIKVLLGSELEGHADIYFTPELRDWIIAGIGHLKIGDRNVSGNVEKITDSDDFEEGVYHEGKIAFFAKGKILGKYLLTAAYDSSKKEDKNDLFQQVEPNRYYPVYGDSSEIGYEAESQQKLYVKVERDRSYIMFGDYETDLTHNEFARYNRTFNGVKADIETEKATLKAFATETNQTVTQDEFQGNGTSGFYFLNRSPVIENSEKIVIETRDRFHSDRVLATVKKTRYADYDIDYTNGKLLFKEPVPSVDESLNPVFIVVAYESNDEGDEYYIYGGRASVRPHEKVEIGATAIVEEQNLEDNTLFGVDAAVKIAEKTELKGELAVSDTLEKGSDSAWRVELASEPLDRLLTEIYYRNVRENFDNPSMTGSEAGTEKYGIKAAFKATEKTVINAEGFVKDNKINETKLESSSIGVNHDFGRVSAETGYAYLREEDEDTSTSQIVYAGASSQITDRLGASIRRDQVISSQEIEYYQTKTRLGLDYKLTENTKASVTQEFQEGDENRKDTTLVGIESRITENTTLTSRYEMENSASGERTQAGIGLNNKWEVRDGLTLNTNIERIQEIRGDSGGDNTAFALAAEYLPEEDVKITGRYELRLGQDETTNLVTFGAGSKLSDNTSILTKLSLWRSRKESGTDTLFDGLIGAAYRPLGRYSLYMLSSLRFKYDRMGSAITNDSTKNLITSHEATYKVSPRWTLHGKYAGKYTWEDFAGKKFTAYTDMILAGINYDITRKWGFGVHAKLMNQYETKMHSIGYIVSTGYNVYKNLYIGVGYNSSELNDRDLSGNDYKKDGFFIEFKFKFDENLLDSLGVFKGERKPE